MKILGALVLAFVLVTLVLSIGWFAYCYAAPLFGLPALSFLQFYVAGFAARCFLGTGNSFTSKS